MPPVTVYSSLFCPYCSMARKILGEKGVPFEEIDILVQPGRRPEMVERSGGRTSVPQIFIGETHVGGCDELMELDSAGKLDPLLAAA